MSLAMNRLVSKIPEYVASARGQAKAAGDKPLKGQPTRKEKKKRKEPESDLGSPSPKKLKTGKGAGKPEGGWPDEEGALGPNGLKRMTGGNPQSKQECRRHSAGGCPYKFCSYKH